ncbi:NAD(P)H-binding protein [Streptosporangiaceae bacterium NEAU-GS5]|nr:NAD(P)H-binding protein [Streptosporangiaceae bacterium NEAU-GS5]
MDNLIVVTGGTGTLGRLLVPRLRAAGRGVRVLTRKARPPENGVTYVTGDLVKDEGVDAAVQGASVVVHCASDYSGDAEATRNLVRAASALPWAPHLVFVSIVGVERLPITGLGRLAFKYLGEKYAAERVVTESGLPWTVLRATQFHDLMLTAAEAMARLPVLPYPTGFAFQPVEANDVAARLAELALGDPAGLAPDIGGPEVFTMADLLRSYLRAAGKRRALLPIRMPGRSARAFRAGVNLTSNGSGGRTWEDFLAERVGAK